MSRRFETFNLLPEWYQGQVATRRWTRVWLAAVGCALPATIAGVVLTHVVVVTPSDHLSDRVRELDLELAAHEQDRTDAPATVVSHATEDPRETLPTEWAGLLRVLAGMSGGEIGFQDVDVSINNESTVVLEISGLATDSQSVLRFAATVEGSGLFAPMNSPAITFDDATETVRFELTAQIPAIAVVEEKTE